MNTEQESKMEVRVIDTINSAMNQTYSVTYIAL